MKAGFTASALAHVAVLAWGMVSLAAPKPLSVPDVEALPIDIIPIESITKTLQGEKTAKPKTTPAPKPTTSPPLPTPAENVGDTSKDIKAEAPKETEAPPVEKTEAPAPKPRPAPPKEPTPVPTPELAPDPKPKTDIAMLLKESDQVDTTESDEEAFEKLPEKVSRPKERPQQEKPDTAQTNKREDAKEVSSAKTETTDKKKTDAKEKAVVNKAQANAGGAKRSDKKAGLGTKKANNSEKLAQSEIDALRGRLEGCWNVAALSGHPDAEKMRARVEFKLTRGGDIDGRVRVKVSGTDRKTGAILSVNVRSAVTECAPYTLPPEKYDTWSDVVVNFSLQDML